MLALTATHTWPISWTETFGFVTGGVCVWLIVREHIWNWPIGLLNNVVFFVLFFNDRLFADAFLQWFYFGLGVWGWWTWLKTKEGEPQYPISHITRWEVISLAILIPILTVLLREVLTAVQGAAPFWDSFTTVLSLSAQYLLCRKRIENWMIWILADAIYVPLYFSRNLPLTAVLYFLLLLMCVYGLKKWWHRLPPLSHSKETPAQ